MLLCDFCSAPNPPRKYPCGPVLMMVVGGVEQWSRDAWAACEICAALIDANEWESLLERTMSTDKFSAYLDDVDREIYKAMVRGLQHKFRVGKMGVM